MSKGILVAQITDCHLPADPQRPYRGINPYLNLRTLLKSVKSRKPDLLLATGDLSEDGSRRSYQALQALFSPLGVPVLALPGNHDDEHILAEVFPGSPVDGIGVSEHGIWKIIRLNSCLPGKPEGRLGEKPLAELADFLDNHGQCPMLIALHHQPVEVGSPWIDKYRLLESHQLLGLLDRHPNVKAVAWGHIHQAFETQRGATTMLGGPSSAINTLPGTQKFTTDMSGPAFRWLELREDKTVVSVIV